jgi:hypothetical protein
VHRVYELNNKVILLIRELRELKDNVYKIKKEKEDNKRNIEDIIK